MRKQHVLLRNTQLHPENDDHWLNHKKQVFQLASKSNQSALPIAPISAPTIPSVTATDFVHFLKINFYNFRNCFFLTFWHQQNLYSKIRNFDSKIRNFDS